MGPGRTVDQVWPAAPRSGARTRAEWALLNREIENCRACPLGSLRTQVVIHRGSLRPRVLFVGEAPGASEDQVGIPFVGPAGKRLDQLIGRLGLLESEFAIVNVIKCHPPGNEFSEGAADACRPFLARQVEFLQPIMVVTLGTAALAAFRPDLLPILGSAGRRFRWRGLTLFPLVHPASTARSGAFRRRWEADGAALSRLLSRLGAGGHAGTGAPSRATV